MALETVRRVGQYAPLAVRYYDDDDVVDAGEAAELLFVRGLAFCAGRTSDGYISDQQVVRSVGVGMPDAMQRAEVLVRVGLWERVVGGFQVRSWLKWNKSAEELGKYRSRDRERKAEKARIRAESDRNPDGVRSGSEPGGPEGSETPSREVSRLSREAEDASRHETAQPDAAAESSQVNPGTPSDRIPRGSLSDSDTQCTTQHSTTQHLETLLDETTLPVSSTRAKGRSAAPRCASDDDPHFAAFWSAYPRKDDKGHARKAWPKAITKADPTAIIAAAEAFAADCLRDKTERRYIALPTTWLNGERWTDQRRPAMANGSRVNGHRPYRDPEDPETAYSTGL